MCPSCFSKIIEKRVRKSLREHNWIKPKDKVLVIDDGTLKAKAGVFLLKPIFKNKPFDITFKKSPIPEKNPKKYAKVLIPKNLDDIAEEYLDNLFNNKKTKACSFIAYLSCVSDDEIVIFAKINNIQGKKPAKTMLGKMLDALEEKYPGSKFGLIKSISHKNI